MVVELLVVRGPYAGQQIQVGAGQVVRIGRTDRSNYALANDTYLSGAHFEIGCDERECRIRDLGSSNGTFVNGAKIVEQAVVQEGDQIAAGETIFLVQAAREERPGVSPAPLVVPTGVAPAAVAPVAAEKTARMYAVGFEPPPREEPAPLSAERKRVEQVLTHQAAPLYAVLDLARDPGVLSLLQSSSHPSPLRYQPLFEGEIADRLATHAPVLVDLGHGAGAQTFLEAALRNGWGQSWGIWLTSASPFEDVLAHLRGFLFIRTQDQQPLYFRLYDPRVLRAFLPACEPQELSAVFGPVVSYLAESDRPDGLLAFSRGSTGLITTQISLAEQPIKAQAAV
jgi:pSer/pThr/pTyr-binding forkhead associated (FHA) protein